MVSRTDVTDFGGLGRSEAPSILQNRFRYFSASSQDREMVGWKKLLLSLAMLGILAHVLDHVLLFSTFAAADSQEACLPTTEELVTGKNITGAAEYSLSLGMMMPRRRLRSIGSRQGPTEPPQNKTSPP